MPLCSIQTCDSVSYCKSFCSRHYWQVRRYGEVLWTTYCGNIFVEGPDFSMMAIGRSYRAPAWALVDKESIHKLKPHRWSLDQNGYAFVRIGGKRMAMHRFLLEIPYREGLVDHINGNRLDNRLSNLRLATPTQNVLNSQKIQGKNIRRGISWRPKRGKWLAHMKVGGKPVIWKEFLNLSDAIAAREEMERIYLPQIT